MKAHDENNNVLIDEDYGAAFGKEIKGHYGADSLMAKDINNYLLKKNKEIHLLVFCLSVEMPGAINLWTRNLLETVRTLLH